VTLPTNDVTSARAALDGGEISSVELVRAALAAADENDGTFGVFLSRFDEQALQAAAAADATRRAGSRSPLLGIPIGVKDVISTLDGETTAQSLVFDRTSISGDAQCIARLRAAGAIVIGKTTTLEFALGLPDDTKPFPVPRNPWSRSHWCGGSSAGSAAGVAAGMMTAAVGTDTGSSIRMPSALCGVTGLKPTFGLVPKSGCVPLAFSLDHVGPLGRTAQDCALLLDAMAGHDPLDPSSADRTPNAMLAGCNGDLRGLTVGVDGLSRYSGEQEDPHLQRLLGDLVSGLQQAGAEVVGVELPFYGEAASLSLIITIAEALAYHTTDLGSRWNDYLASTRMGLALGAFVSASDYLQAQRVRRTVRAAVADLFEQVDLIVTPTVSRPAPRMEEAAAYVGSFFTGKDLAFHTSYWNAMGNPAISVPIGFSEGGLPLAGQITGRPFEDDLVLRAAHAFQQVSDWHRQPCVEMRQDDQTPPPPPAASDLPAQPTGADAEAALRRYGVTPDPQEWAALEAGGSTVRMHAEVLHAFGPARYEEPATTFRA
jgi:aspartyl-tRNA(Asn)/glutamyl-tRNA(Gln) amidotransferase subunit A